MIESSRNLKEELALSYLHFVELQNAELISQRDAQLEELSKIRNKLL